MQQTGRLRLIGKKILHMYVSSFLPSIEKKGMIKIARRTQFDGETGGNNGI